MYAVAYRKTEQSIKLRALKGLNAVEVQQERLRVQREKYEADLAVAVEREIEARRKEAERKDAVERAAAFAAELKAQGFRYRPSYKSIEMRACRLFKVSISDIRGNRRHRELAFARQFVMYWSIRLTPLSMPQIGRLMGGKDHTTVLYGARAYPEKRAYMGRHLPAKSSAYARQHLDRET